VADDLPENITWPMINAALAALGLEDVTVERLTMDSQFLEVSYLPSPPSKVFSASAKWPLPYFNQDGSVS
jgi:hypothetical protein